MTTMKPCYKCESPTEGAIVLVIAGDDFEFALCAGCEDDSMKRFRECQRQFGFLIDNGVSRERANAIMIRRIDKKP